jgi:hypothetical protein
VPASRLELEHNDVILALSGISGQFCLGEIEARSPGWAQIGRVPAERFGFGICNPERGRSWRSDLPSGPSKNA